MTPRALIVLLSFTLCLTACGNASDVPSLTDTSSEPDPFATVPPFDFGFDTPSTGSATSSPAPIVQPTPAPGTPPVNNGTSLPNNFFRHIGRSYLQTWLYQPAGVTTVGDFVLVADGQRKTDPLGPYGGVLMFDGRGTDASRPVGGIYMTLAAGTPPTRLGAGMKAVAAGSDVLYAMDDQGVYGFMLDTRNALNLGRAYTGTGSDLAVAGPTVYVAQSGAINAFAYGTFATDPATPSLPLSARGLGSDPAGNLYVATATQVLRYTNGQSNLTFDGKGVDGQGPGFEDLMDVAADPRNGDIYALDRHAVLRFDSTGHFLSRFGQDQIQGATSVAVGAHGEIYVTDAAARQVLQFEAGR
ncbi:MAG TPA: hypothetical protein V6D05_13615 [Stenomitos sp.]